MCYSASAMKGDLRRWLRGAVIGVAAGVVAVAALHLPLAETHENHVGATRFFSTHPGTDERLIEHAKRHEASTSGTPSR